MTNKLSAASSNGSRELQSRTRVITWENQEPLALRKGELSGVEILRRIAVGELPKPAVSSLFGWDELFEFEEGHVVVSFVPQECHYNPLGVVHGGVAMSLVDTAMGMSACSVLPADASCAIVQMKTSFLRVMTRNIGPVRCDGIVVQVAEGLVSTMGKITDERGRLYAHGTSVYRVILQ